MIDYCQFEKRVTFITGMSKNAGKTTFLNLLMGYLRQTTSVACLSVGVDGEQTDLLCGRQKPRITVEEGDCVVTAESALARTGISFEVMYVFTEKTTLGRMVLVRVVRGGNVELIGPENNLQLRQIIDVMVDEFDLKTILVDGAANRMTQIVAGRKSSFVKVMKVTPLNLSKAVEEMKIDLLLNGLPLASDVLKEEEDVLCFEGALTSVKLRKISSDFRAVVINDCSAVFLPLKDLKKMGQKYDVFVNKKVELDHFVVNLMDVTEAQFCEAVANEQLMDRVVFNPYFVNSGRN